MDKIFSFNRVFIGFCALLVAVVLAWNYTREQFLMEEAKLIGRRQAEWSWPSQGVSTNVDDVQAKILKRSDTDAEVEVQGKQKIFLSAPSGGEQPATEAAVSPKPEDSDFKVVLTLYKNGNSKYWLLGKVEGQ